MGSIHLLTLLPNTPSDFYGNQCNINWPWLRLNLNEKCCLTTVQSKHERPNDLWKALIKLEWASKLLQSTLLVSSNKLSHVYAKKAKRPNSRRQIKSPSRGSYNGAEKNMEHAEMKPESKFQFFDFLAAWLKKKKWLYLPDAQCFHLILGKIILPELCWGLSE